MSQFGSRKQNLHPTLIIYLRWTCMFVTGMIMKIKSQIFQFSVPWESLSSRYVK